jgi:outer membrane protein OmpA-like peptidoglycan-associated protein
VKKYLVEQGKIEGGRLEPRGMGEKMPITPDNKTADGRAANRRVEFNLKDCKKTIQ